MGKELSLAIKIGGKLDGSLSAAVNAAQAQLNGIAKSANTAMTAATVAVAAAGIKLVQESVQTYQEYQSALNSAAATAGVERGTADYEKMNAAAREAGRTTVKTAEESANALEYMALAGWSVEDSTKALMPVLKLSAATGADLATTSDLVTDSMANLGLNIDDLNHYLDVSATANNKSNQTALQLQEAYLGVGGVLKNLNAPIEESAAVLGVLANRGTKGSEAGTALSAILVNMQKTTGDSAKAMKQLGVSMYDANGDARSILDVFQDVSDKTSGMTEEQRNLMYQMICGKSHVDSFAKIMAGFTDTTADGTKEIYSLLDAFQNCDGALDKLYDIKTDTLEGSAQKLSSAFDDMKISIGEQVAPMLQGLYDDLATKMPQIGDIIVKSLQKIIPAAQKVLSFLVNNSDKVVSGAIKMAEAFAAIKIGTGAIKGITSIVELIKNLSTVTKAAGITRVLQGLIGTFTGINTAAYTAGAGITAFIAAAAPIAAVTAGIIALIAAIKTTYSYLYNKKYNYAEGMNEQADAIGKATTNLVKYNEIAAEVAKQREIIQNPESSAAQIENAKERLQEIAEMVGKEYNLVINADTTQLENAVNMAQQLSRTELIDNSKDLIKKAQGGADQYKIDTGNIAKLEQQQSYYQTLNSTYKDLVTSSDLYRTSFDNGLISQEQYLSNMDALYQKAKDAGIQFEYLGDNLTEYSVGDFITAISGGADMSRMQLEGVNSELERVLKNVKEFDEATQKAGQYLTQALASDIKAGNAFGTDTDITLITQLGEAMVAAGKSTQELGTQFAAAKSGYAEFSAAIADGKASEMAQSFMEYEKSIGETAETAVQGAALIANGFENVSQATAAGDEAINAVINDLKSFGDMQGLFDGLDNNGVADKLTDIAHAMNLIPANKSITINADGNFEVIQDAENQIASLKSIGNVNVSINADGDLTVFDETTSKMQFLQGLGAVDLTVNADGNIDVLNKAGEVISTIDSKSAEVSINGQVSGVDQVQQAAETAENVNDKTATVTVNATDNATVTIQQVQNALTTLDGTKTNPAINANDKASSVISSVSKQLDALDGKTAKTVVITEYKTQGTPPANNASGTNYFKGGLTYVNDQDVTDPREVIEYGGKQWYYEGRNVLANLPRGAKIYNAAESRALIDGSHRNGLERVPFDGYVAELHRGEQVLTAEQADEYRGGGVADLLEWLEEYFDDPERRGGGSGSGDGGGESKIVFSPNITVNGNGDKETIKQTIRMSFAEFKEYMEEYERDNRRKRFA
jgi:TP901 family phage tail tape measure protein